MNTTKFYNDMAKMTLKLLQKWGGPFICRRKTGTSFDPVEGVSSDTYEEITYKGVLTDINGRLVSEVRMVGNSPIMTTDFMIICGPEAVVQDDDQIFVDGVRYTVLKLQPVKSGGVLLLNKHVVRR